MIYNLDIKKMCGIVGNLHIPINADKKKFFKFNDGYRH
jgi:hypothetical protein